MQYPLKIAFLILICFFACQQQKDITPIQNPNLKITSGHFISGDTLPSPIRIDMNGMKPFPIDQPVITEHKIAKQILNEAKTIKTNGIKRSLGFSVLPAEPLVMLKKSKVSNPEKIKIGSTSSHLIPNKIVKTYNHANGLKEDYVNTFAMDSTGNLWCTTNNNGLLKFNGSYAYYYSLNQGAPSDAFNGMTFDRKGQLWTTFNEGLLKFDGKYFTSYKFPSTATIYSAKNGKLWMIVENDIVVLDPESMTTQKISLNQQDALLYLFMDENEVLAATKQGLFRIPLDFELANRKEISSILFAEELHPIIVTSIIKIDNKKYWLGTDNGIVHLDLNDSLEMTWYNSSSGLPVNGEGKCTVLGMSTDKNNQVFALIGGFGLFRMELFEKPYSFVHHKNEVSYLSKSIFKLKDQIWIYSGNAGICLIDDNPFKFWYTETNLPDFTSSTYDQWGRLWMGSFGNGIFMLEEDTNNGVIRLYNYNTSNGLNDNYIDDVFADQKGNLWIGSRGRRLSRIELEKDDPYGQIYYYQSAFGFPGDVVPMIVQDKKGSIWCTLFEHYGPKRTGFAKLDEKGLLFYAKEHGLLDQDTWALDFDANNNLWIMGFSGAAHKYVFNTDYSIASVTQFEKDKTFLDDVPRTMTIDQNDDLWVGFDHGNQLTKIAMQSDASYAFHRFDKENGLQYSKIYSLLSDNVNDLWVGATEGLIKVSKHAEHKLNYNFQSYNGENGLPTRGIHLNGIIQKNPEEILVNGFEKTFWFNPNELRSKSAPKTMINEFMLFDEAVKWDQLVDEVKSSGVSITQFKYDSLSNWNSIPINLSLKHDNNFISLECIGIDPLKEGEIEYSYTLSNVTKDWSKPNSNSKIVFGSLRPNNYTFNVRSRIEHGEWGPPATMKFTIRPPWWKSRLAILAYILAGILFVYGIIKIRVAIALDKVKEMQEMRSKISTDLHDDVGSLLTGISMQTEYLAMESKDQMKNELEVLGERSKNAQEKMRDIVWAMDATKDKYENLIDRMWHFCNKTFSKSPFEYNFETKGIEGTAFLSPDRRQHIYMIFKESLTNILKYSEGNKVSIHFFKSDDALILSIHDNGAGPKTINSAGQGLENMKKRAQKMGGRLEISNANGFLVKLKLDLI